MGRRLFLAIAVATTVPAGALASTELNSGSGFPGFRPETFVPADREVEAAVANAFHLDLSTGEGEPTFAVDEALLKGPAPPATNNDRFQWVFIVIAFAGLTAAFAGKPSGGRGLIAG